MHRLFITVLFIVSLLICVIKPALAEDSNPALSYSQEVLTDGSAWLVSIDSGASEVFYGGFSLGQVTSSKLVSYRETETLTTLYFYLGLQAPWQLSPYAEGGISLVETLVDNIFNSDAEESADWIDYYVSAGLRFPVNERFSVSLYAKRYAFIYRNIQNTAWITSTPHGYGISASLNF